MSRSDLIRALKDSETKSNDPLAPMSLDDAKLRGASKTNQLTTAWFCTLNTIIGPACN